MKQNFIKLIFIQGFTRFETYRNRGKRHSKWSIATSAGSWGRAQPFLDKFNTRSANICSWPFLRISTRKVKSSSNLKNKKSTFYTPQLPLEYIKPHNTRFGVHQATQQRQIVDQLRVAYLPIAIIILAVTL